MKIVSRKPVPVVTEEPVRATVRTVELDWNFSSSNQLLNISIQVPLDDMMGILNGANTADLIYQRVQESIRFVK